MQTTPPLTRLPSGNLAARIGTALVTVRPNHADRQRLRYWAVFTADNRRITAFVSTPKIALAIAITAGVGRA